MHTASRLSPNFPSTRFRKRRRVQADIEIAVQHLRRNANVKLHLGCGNDYIEGMTNVDLYAPRADIQAAIWDLPMYENGTVDHIEAHHVIEHLSFSEVSQTLGEWARIVKPGGHILISCPDLDRIFRRWRTKPAQREEWLRMIYGSQEHMGMFHKSGYTAESLSALISKHGFEPIFVYTPYPARPTPSLFVVGQKR